jgi:hypothetical protein
MKQATPPKKRRVSQAVLDGLQRAREAKKAQQGNNEKLVQRIESVARCTEPVTETVLDMSLDAVLMRAIAANPAVLGFVTCWELPQAGIALPPCSMEEADAALKRAQQRHRMAERRGSGAAETVFAHAGDIGDIIACLPIIRAMGGGRLVITPRPPGEFMGREGMEGARYEALRPLLEAQEYVTGVEFGEAPEGCEDFRRFRLGLPGGENLIVSQARHVGCDDFSFDPWLTVPDPIPGPAVFARSERYQGTRMPWHIISSKHPDAVFIGLESEHAAFQKMLGRPITHRKTADLLELAKFISGCERFFGGQSAPWWIAVGLGVPACLEVCPTPEIQNSIVDRGNLFYVGNADQVGRTNWR